MRYRRLIAPILLFLLIGLALLAGFLLPRRHSRPTTTSLPPATVTNTPTPTPFPPPTVAPSPTRDSWNEQAAALISSRADDLNRLRCPARYEMELEVSPERSRLAGHMRINYTNPYIDSLDQLAFRLYANLPERNGKITIYQFSRDGRPAEVTFEAENTTLLVPLSPPLAANAETAFTIDFALDIPTQSNAGYREFGNFDGVVALAGFYPMIPARMRGNEWSLEIPPNYGDSTVADVALYRVALTIPRNMIVAATGVVIEQSQDLNAQTKTLKLVSGPAREFAIVMSAEYQILSNQVSETTVRSFFRPQDRAGGERALQVATDALSLFNELFGIYPYSELDIAATPTLAGGIEYPGLIVLNQNYYRGGATSRFDWANVHEVAHQWWYAIVGNDQVEEPWLDEALTNYSTWLYYQKTTTPEVAEELFRQVFVEPAFRARELGQDQAINLPVRAYAAANYGPIVYAKGPQFIHALRERTGEETFFAMLREYRRRYEYRLAAGADFLALAEELSGQDLRSFYAEWGFEPSH